MPQEKFTYQLTINNDPDYVYLIRSALPKTDLPDPLEILRRLQIFDEDSLEDFEEAFFTIQEVGSISYDLDEACFGKKPKYCEKDTGRALHSLIVVEGCEGLYHIYGEIDGDLILDIGIPSRLLDEDEMTAVLQQGMGIIVLNDFPNDNLGGTPAWTFDLYNSAAPLFTPANRPTDMQFFSAESGKPVDEIHFKKQDGDQISCFYLAGGLINGKAVALEDIPEVLPPRDLDSYFGPFWTNKILLENPNSSIKDQEAWVFDPHTPIAGLEKFVGIDGKPVEKLLVTKNWEGFYLLEGCQGYLKKVVDITPANLSGKDYYGSFYPMNSQQLISVIGEERAEQVFTKPADAPGQSTWSFDLEPGIAMDTETQIHPEAEATLTM